MAILRSRAKTLSKPQRGNELVARKLELCSRGARAKSVLPDWRRGLDHEEVVARDLDRIGRIKLERSVAAKCRSGISQHQSGTRIVFWSHSGQTNPGVEQQRAPPGFDPYSSG